MASLDSFKCEREMVVRGGTYTYYDLKAAEKNGLVGISKLPRSLKVLLENLLRHEDGNSCLLYTSPSPRDGLLSRMPSSA